LRELECSIGGRHNARVLKTWRGSFEAFCNALMSKVPETDDKASVGWVCGATFDPSYRDSENFRARHFLTFDYDHIGPDELQRVLGHFESTAHLAYTTWSHSADRPRIRVWLPLSRPVGYDEFQAISRKVASGPGIELAARESHVPSQYMYRPATKPFDLPIQVWKNLEGPWVDVDAILATYADWTDRTSWPHRAEGDGVHNQGMAEDPRNKPGLVGAFCRAFPVTAAIDRFELPYRLGSSPGRLTYTDGSRPDGAIIYDEDTKLHSHHDTDPARGQNNAYDLVRLHRFGYLDPVGAPLAELPSSREMAEFARELPETRAQFVADAGFEDLDKAEALDTSWLYETTGLDRSALGTPVIDASRLPARIKEASSKLTDQENARRIQRRHNGKIISVGGTFYVWAKENTHWRRSASDSEAKSLVMDLSKLIEREAIGLKEKLEADASKKGATLTDVEEARISQLFRWAADSGQNSKLNACMEICRSQLFKLPEDLNLYSHLLACESGTIDLRTGELKPSDPNDFITGCAPIKYNPDAKCPRFDQFILEIFSTPEETAFAKRWFGYCITGSVAEQKMVFHIGKRSNGKGTLMRILRRILGKDYCADAAPGLLQVDGKGATPELADLLGTRMVTVSETEDGMDMKHGLVKRLTGGDAIRGRQLHKGFIEFEPTHKLQLFTNNEPKIHGHEEAMWRRIVFLKYPYVYGSPAEIAHGSATRLEDKHLDDALRNEAPGIFRWLIEGAREWYERGLDIPERVMNETLEYRRRQDTIGLFFAERTVPDPKGKVTIIGAAQSLYVAYQGWCGSSGYTYKLNKTRFEAEAERVLGRRITKWKEGGQTYRGFEGIRLTDTGLLE
jgi:P4 family phage/plasmid primase-like protien